MQCERIKRAWRLCPGQQPVMHKEERSQVDANDAQHRLLTLPGRGDDRADAMMQQMEQLMERSFGGGLFGPLFGGPLFGGPPFGGFDGTPPPGDSSSTTRLHPNAPRPAQPHRHAPPAMKVEEV